MKRIDITQWGKFVVGDLMERKDLAIKKPGFDKRLDVSTEKDEEFSLPLVNAKDGNNGIMYYGREEDFESEAMCLDIVQNGAVATGNVYAQIQKTGVLWDAYLVKPKDEIGEKALLFLSKVMQKAIKQKYGYDNKAIWDKVQKETILLPQTPSGTPDWAYMEAYMQRIEQRARQTVASLSKLTGGGKRKRLNISEWREFKVGELFDIRKPEVYHSREVTEQAGGIPYVVRSKFNNGMSLRVNAKTIKTLNPAGVISFGSENSTFFYQQEPWCSGRDIYYIDTQALPKYACFFLASCLQQIGQRYTYSYGLFPDLLRQEKIKLPVLASGTPDWPYMEAYMQALQAQAAQRLAAQQGSINL